MTTMCVLGDVTELGLKNAKAYCISAAGGDQQEELSYGRSLVLTSPQPIKRIPRSERHNELLVTSLPLAHSWLMLLCSCSDRPKLGF